MFISLTFTDESLAGLLFLNRQPDASVICMRTATPIAGSLSTLAVLCRHRCLQA